MNYYKIKNYVDFDPKHTGYIVALSDYSPVVNIFEKNKHHNIHHTLWYPMRDQQLPSTYTDYFKEKLGVADQSEALRFINDWNKLQASDSFEVQTFSKIFTVSKIRYGVIKTAGSMDIIMSLKGNQIPHVVTFSYGSGGYRWAYLDNKSVTLEDDVKEKFGLRKSEVKSFIKHYISK